MIPLDLLSVLSAAEDGVAVVVEVLGVVALEEELVKMAASGELGDNPRSFGQSLTLAFFN